jgi:hypothetical protein
MNWRNQISPGDVVVVLSDIAGIAEQWTVANTRRNQFGRLQIKIGPDWISAACVYKRLSRRGL